LAESASKRSKIENGCRFLNRWVVQALAAEVSAVATAE